MPSQVISNDCEILAQNREQKLPRISSRADTVNELQRKTVTLNAGCAVNYIINIVSGGTLIDILHFSFACDQIRYSPCFTQWDFDSDIGLSQKCGMTSSLKFCMQSRVSD